MKAKLISVFITALLLQGTASFSFAQNVKDNKQSKITEVQEDTPSNRLPVAIFLKSTAEVFVLLAQGADVNYNNGAAIFMLAQVPDLDQNIIDWVLDEKQKPDVNVHDKKYNTPLHFAAALGITSSLKGLIKAKAKVNALNYEKRTPLHITAFGVNGTADYNSADALIAAGAKVTLKDKYGMTPRDIAIRENTNPKLVNFLKQKEEEAAQKANRKSTEEQKKIKELAQSLKDKKEKF